MSAISGTIGAILGQQSADKATEANQSNTRQTNQANILLAMAARGEPITAAQAKQFGLPSSMVGQSSAILPYYLSQTETQQAQNAANAVAAIQAANGSPASQAQQFAALLAKYQPQFDQTNKTAADITSGAMTEQMLNDIAPVQAANLAVATGRKNAALESLGAQLNRIDAIQARRGFSGDSLASNLLKATQARAIATQGADDFNVARLQNAQQTAATRQAGRQLQIANLGLPDTMAQAAMSRTGMPGRAVAANLQTSMAPLASFNIGPHQFNQLTPMPTVQPRLSTLGALAQGNAQLGNTAANIFADQQSAAAWGKALKSAQAGSGAGAGGASGAGLGMGSGTDAAVDYGEEL